MLHCASVLLASTTFPFPLSGAGYFNVKSSHKSMKRIGFLIAGIFVSTVATSESLDSINKGKFIEASGFACAHKVAHMLPWLGRGADYQKFVVSDVEQELYRQQPGSQLIKLECTGEPKVVTKALRQESDGSKAIVSQFSATFPLKATIRLSEEIWVLSIEQNYLAQNIDSPSARKLTQNFTVTGSTKQ
jgi:hypothetical protein